MRVNYKPRSRGSDTLGRGIGIACFVSLAAITLIGCDGSAPTSTASEPLARSSLTVNNVEKAVVTALDFTRVSGNVRVVGIQESPQTNSATTDLRFDNFQYNADSYGTPRPKSEKTPPPLDVNSPDFFRDMAKTYDSLRGVRTLTGHGVALLKHYNDGRWVLTEVHVGESYAAGVAPNLQISSSTDSSESRSSGVVSSPAASSKASREGGPKTTTARSNDTGSVREAFVNWVNELTKPQIMFWIIVIGGIALMVTINLVRIRRVPTSPRNKPVEAPGRILPHIDKTTSSTSSQPGPVKQQDSSRVTALNVDGLVSQEETGRKICPSCAGVVRRTSRYCDNCGKRLDATNTADGPRI